LAAALAADKMLRVDQDKLAYTEAIYPAITATIRYFEAANLPACPRCQSTDTAAVQCGVIGRTIHLAFATTKFHLCANAPIARHFCNSCDAVDYRKFYSRLHNAMIRVYDKPGNVMETHEHKGDFREF
jgi:hypothetical protein